MGSWSLLLPRHEAAMVEGEASNSEDVAVQTLLLSKIQTVRSTHVILGTFSLVGLLLLLARILLDARRAASLHVQLRPRKFAILHAVHPAERPTLVICCAMILQQLVFIGVSGAALGSVMVSGCGATAQAVLAMLFLVPYTFLVFGFEMAVRAMRNPPFASPPKLTLPICLGCIATMTFLTWLPTAVSKTPDRCFGSLVWWPYRYSTMIVSLLSTVLFFYVLVAAIILVQLLRTVKMCSEARIAASRIFYYLCYATVILILFFPFYAEAGRDHRYAAYSASSRIAPIALSISGLLFAMWHYFDRANAHMIALRPFETQWQHKRRFRFFGPNDLRRKSNITWPRDNGKQRESTQNVMKDLEIETEKLRQEYAMLNEPQEQSTEETTQVPAPILLASKPGHTRNGSKSSYSIFPTQTDTSRGSTIGRMSPSSGSRSRTPSPTKDVRIRYSSFDELVEMADVKPPEPLFAPIREHRENSVESIETVHIAMRFSVSPTDAEIQQIGEEQGHARKDSDTLKPLNLDPLSPHAQNRATFTSSEMPRKKPAPSEKFGPISQSDDLGQFFTNFSFETINERLPTAEQSTPPVKAPKNLKVSCNKSLPPLPLGASTQRPRGPLTIPIPKRPDSPALSLFRAGGGLRMNPVTPRANTPSTVGSKSPSSRWT